MKKMTSARHAAATFLKGTQPRRPTRTSGGGLAVEALGAFGAVAHTGGILATGVLFFPLTVCALVVALGLGPFSDLVWLVGLIGRWILLSVLVAAAGWGLKRWAYPSPPATLPEVPGWQWRARVAGDVRELYLVAERGGAKVGLVATRVSGRKRDVRMAAGSNGCPVVKVDVTPLEAKHAGMLAAAFRDMVAATRGMARFPRSMPDAAGRGQVEELVFERKGGKSVVVNGAKVGLGRAEPGESRLLAAVGAEWLRRRIAGDLAQDERRQRERQEEQERQKGRERRAREDAEREVEDAAAARLLEGRLA